MKLYVASLQIVISLLVTTSLCGQQVANTVYFSADWDTLPTRDSAKYMSVFTPEKGVYKMTTYTIPENRIHKTMYFKTPSFDTIAPGTIVEYYASGQTKYSSIVNEDLRTVSLYHWYPGGQLKAKYLYDPKTQKTTTIGYTEDGEIIPGFIIQREAEFPGGLEAWSDYVRASMTFYDENIPSGTYQFNVQFIVDTSGFTRDVKSLSSPGYGLEESAIQMILNSPRWKPAILYNEPVAAVRIQPITIQVPKKKSKRRD